MIAASFKTTLARNTVWMVLGQGLRLVIQALYFVEIARSLGVRNYGAFIGVVGDGKQHAQIDKRREDDGRFMQHKPASLYCRPPDSAMNAIDAISAAQAMNMYA